MGLCFCVCVWVCLCVCDRVCVIPAMTDWCCAVSGWLSEASNTTSFIWSWSPSNLSWCVSITLCAHSISKAGFIQILQNKLCLYTLHATLSPSQISDSAKPRGTLNSLIFAISVQGRGTDPVILYMVFNILIMTRWMMSSGLFQWEEMKLLNEEGKVQKKRTGVKKSKNLPPMCFYSWVFLDLSGKRDEGWEIRSLTKINLHPGCLLTWICYVKTTTSWKWTVITPHAFLLCWFTKYQQQRWN